MFRSDARIAKALANAHLAEMRRQTRLPPSRWRSKPGHRLLGRLGHHLVSLGRRLEKFNQIPSAAYLSGNNH